MVFLTEAEPGVIVAEAEDFFIKIFHILITIYQQPACRRGSNTATKRGLLAANW